MSTLVPSGDVSAAFSESSTVWSLKSSSSGFSLPDGAAQKVLSRSASGSGILITVRTGEASALCPLSSEDRQSYLSSTRFVHPQNPQIMEISQKISRQKDLIHEAELFVGRYITQKELGYPLPTDLQVLSLKAGDCKAHAALLVSVLRSAGIPARAAAGVVLLPSFGGKENVFGFHMWAEAYVGGRWVIADATFAGAGHFNRYLKLAPHSLRTEAPLDYIEAVSSIQNLSISRS
jgi:transglutaminase-like putative cysteine protease